MNIILGFPRKADLMRDCISGIRRILKESQPDTVKGAIKEFVAGFGDGGDIRINIHHQHYDDHEDYISEDFTLLGDRYRIVEGHLWYVQRDHAMSHDGTALLQLPFCVTYVFSDTYGGECYADHALKGGK